MAGEIQYTQWALAAQAWAAGTGPAALPGICPAEAGDPKPAREGVSLNIRSWGSQEPCRSRVMAELVGPGTPLAPPVVYRSCVHTEMNAVSRRLGAPQLWFGPDAEDIVATWEEVHSEMRGRLSDAYWGPLTREVGERLVPTPFETWLAHYDGPGRRMMREARLESQRTGLLDQEHVKVVAFPKVELLPKLLDDVLSKRGKARLIQGRHPQLTSCVGPSFHALGKALARIWDVRSSDPLPVVYASSCSAEDLGRWYESCVSSGLRPWPDDAREWDASQGPGPLTSWCRDVADLNPVYGVRRLLQNRLGGTIAPRQCRTKHGLRYTLAWQVCSGDGDTSCGNSATHGKVRIHRRAHVVGPASRARTAINGDNSLPMYPLEMSADMVRQERLAYRAYGYTMEGEGGGGDPYDGQICSGRIWACQDGWKYGPKIGRVLSKTFWWLNPRPGHRWRRAWLRSVALSLLDNTRHIPVLRVIVSRILDETAGEPTLPLQRELYAPWRINAEGQSEASAATFEQMAHLYGVPPGAIDALEDWVYNAPLWGASWTHPVLDQIVQVDLA